jgi:molybdopterin biosynthesis enzyme
MTDSGSDGWNGYVMGIRQSNIIMGIFGDKFISGASSGPVSILVQGDQFVQIVLINSGSNSVQVGFVVKAPNGTIIH